MAIGDEKQIETAVTAAKRALPIWAALSPQQRASYLLKCAVWMKEQYGSEGEMTSLKRQIVEEMGKPLPEADIEVIETASFIEYFCSISHSVLSPKEIPLNKDLWPTKRSTVLMEPVGVVGIIKPWNYPLELPMWSLVPALLAGNTVIFKPSEKAPGIGLVIGNMVDAVGMPPGVVNIVTGDKDTGRALVLHPGVNMVSFTGSVDAGREVAETCGRLLKRVTLELGGNDAAIVLPDVDLDLAANGLVWGAFCNAGQVCVGIKRVFVIDTIADRLISKLVERTKALRLGVDVGPLIDESQLISVGDMVDSAIADGATVLIGGARANERRGYFYCPTILSRVTNAMRIMRDECFGPVLPVTVCKTVDEAVFAANESSYGLGASIWTGDIEKGAQLARSLKVGMVWVNDVNVAFAETPWGGVKNSGIGYELSADSLLEYVTRKHVSIETSSENSRFWWYPYEN